MQNWHILQIMPEFRKVFGNKTTIVFQKNKNIQGLIGGRLIEDGKTALKKLNDNTCEINKISFILYSGSK